ncbi:MAG: elongation factor P [Candidatus Komeilibacteria bacterium RIFCSPLOWO2_01_FULL_52_15]|uniref:Elongation factor P n=2 Tax=Candidatus Komeiliibacteriota TaxID=1817908 RepID=A0A1G2BUD7_9BACT|nr:MAG: elongation factor P [Candidatus Komeilibacteria bacterium RIFCSPHIGHO2_01_FULL_52_14]OGY91867.1 MAG: elongation factor P [Candidatus Komeilibacteria bacterium RIFCSPLOWO2_01_FULL_52_15]
MLTMSEIKLGTVISINDQPYVVTFTQHIKKARSGATLRTKLKNLITGSTLEKSFAGGDHVEEADIERKSATFLYVQEGRFYFMDTENFEQYEFAADAIGDYRGYLTEGLGITVLLYNGNAVSIELPKKITLKVVSAPPGVRGDTSGNVTKTVTLETGLEVRAPLFIKDGDSIRVNTDSGEYVERA